MGGVIANWSADRIEGFETRSCASAHARGPAAVYRRGPDRRARPLSARGHGRLHHGRGPRGLALLAPRRGQRPGRRGAAGGGETGPLWLNLRHANEHLPEFAALCDEISAEKEAHFTTRILNRDLGLLISSPNARVFYHLDVPLSSLWQVRGVKRIWFYPRGEPFVDPAWLERCVHGTARGRCRSPLTGTPRPRPSSSPPATWSPGRRTCRTGSTTGR